MNEQQELPQGQLMEVGFVAASNIAQTLGLPSTAIGVIQQAMADEIKIMSNQFATTLMDMRARAESKPTWEKPLALGVVAFALVVGGFLLGVLI